MTSRHETVKSSSNFTNVRIHVRLQRVISSINELIITFHTYVNCTEISCSRCVHFRWKHKQGTFVCAISNRLCCAIWCKILCQTQICCFFRQLFPLVPKYMNQIAVMCLVNLSELLILDFHHANLPL